MSKPGKTVGPPRSSLAIRLAHEDKILNTPKVVATIGNSLTLAKQIYDRAMKAFPQMFC